MPIKYPSHIRGVTAGALRQVARNGYTTASGGLFSESSVNSTIRGTRPSTYFSKIEPAGILMSELETKEKELRSVTEAIQSAAFSLVESAKDTSRALQESSGKMRDGTDKLSAAMDKFMKVAHRADFEKTVHLTLSLVDSLERLAALEERGLLEKVMKAMR